MRSASPKVKTGPRTKEQQRYFAIIKLYTKYDTHKICRILNERFRDRKWDIDPAETDVLWEKMSAGLSREHEVVKWVRRQRFDGWRVQRVLRYAQGFN